MYHLKYEGNGINLNDKSHIYRLLHLFPNIENKAEFTLEVVMSNCNGNRYSLFFSLPLWHSLNISYTHTHSYCHHLITPFTVVCVYTRRPFFLETTFSPKLMANTKTANVQNTCTKYGLYWKLFMEHTYFSSAFSC